MFRLTCIELDNGEFAVYINHHYLGSEDASGERLSLGEVLEQLSLLPGVELQTLLEPVATPSHATPVPVNTAGRVPVQRIPDATQRLWIAPWVDTDDNFHQPAVVEFVKNKSHWDESYRVIGEGGE